MDARARPERLRGREDVAWRGVLLCERRGEGGVEGGRAEALVERLVGDPCGLADGVPAGARTEWVRTDGEAKRVQGIEKEDVLVVGVNSPPDGSERGEPPAVGQILRSQINKNRTSISLRISRDQKEKNAPSHMRGDAAPSRSPRWYPRYPSVTARPRHPQRLTHYPAATHARAA